MTTFDALTALKGRAEGNSLLKGIYDDQCNVLGGMATRHQESTYPLKMKKTPEYPDVTTLQPDNLEEFRATLRSISYRIREKISLRLDYLLGRPGSGRHDPQFV